MYLSSTSPCPPDHSTISDETQARTHSYQRMSVSFKTCLVYEHIGNKWNGGQRVCKVASRFKTSIVESFDKKTF